MNHFAFESPHTFWLILPVAAAVGLSAWSLRRRGMTPRQVAALTVCRGVGLLLLLWLAARPVWRGEETEETPRNEVILLVDKSESMSLKDGDQTRYQDALQLVRDELAPALKDARLRVTPVLFAEEAEVSRGDQLAATTPDGQQTDLAKAIAGTLAQTQPPPLAVVALTDGVATQTADNSRAITALIENRVPFVGIGFGSETGSRVLSLEQVTAPALVPLDREFEIAAQLRFTGDAELPAFDLLLLRDGQFLEKKRIPAFSGSRVWQESFTRTESKAATHTYTVQLFPPGDSGIKSPKTKASAVVRVSDEESLRVLYLQGGLTWDYKFIRLALWNDPSIQLTGLSRTGSQSRFFQNLEDDAILEGFPETLEELSPFRVVVLSNLKPSDLTKPQQELLARYCGEYGGGVLMVGGSGTFNASWVDSPLEQLLPVRFSPNVFRNRQVPPFRLKLTSAAENSPVFQIGQEGDNQSAWANTPLFTEYAAVESTKPGAQVWIEHPQSVAGGDRAPLLATQQFGSGLSGVFCVQNLWRWRLAKQSNTAHHDRFWRQLFRHLAGGAHEPLLIHYKDQDLEPDTDIQLIVERRPDPNPTKSAAANYRFRVTDEERQVLTEEPLTLKPGQSRELSFHPKKAGFYTTTVIDPNGVPLTQRSVEIQEIAKEFLQTACNMDNLKQWANLSGGMAIKAEDCRDFGEVLAQWSDDKSDLPKPPRLVKPAGINGWTMAALIGCFCAEWILRKRWGLF